MLMLTASHPTAAPLRPKLHSTLFWNALLTHPQSQLGLLPAEEEDKTPDLLPAFVCKDAPPHLQGEGQQEPLFLSS